MKKLLLLINLCTAASSYALTKNDLGSAIRSLDVAGVQQIIANEKFTQKEYDRYVALTDEVVCSRKTWMLARAVFEDVTTPYEGPSLDRLVAESMGGFLLASISGLFLTAPENLFTENTMISFKASAIAGTILLAKFFYDYQKARRMTWEHAELLRKKYENAVTIQQLVYTINIAA